METKTFEKVNETIYIDKLDNGLEIYMYPTKKTKNFYISISVKYGSRILSYKLDNKIFDIIPGSAHFLEHKVMALSENKEFSSRINKYGSLANAWTNTYGTNYNIYGSKDLIGNLILLLDIFYHIDINEKCVNEEKGIIGEEIDMYKDRISFLSLYKLYENMFKNLYIKNTTTGERSDIEKITSESLNKIYNDFYISNNTFICVCGDFDPKEVSNVIGEYISKLNLKSKELPLRIKEKEQLEVVKDYEVIEKGIENEVIKIGYKIPKNIFNIDDDDLLRCYFDIILSCYLGTTSPLFEQYKREGLFISAGHSVRIVDDFLIITIEATCKDSEEYAKKITEDIKKININEEDFERKKKLYLKSYILDFDSIESIEYNIVMSLMVDNKILYDEYSFINNMNYKEAKRLLELLTFDNKSTIKVK